MILDKHQKFKFIHLILFSNISPARVCGQARLWVCLVEWLEPFFSHFKQHYTHFHIFSPIRISKTPKQHYSNSFTKRAVYIQAYFIFLLNVLEFIH